MFYLPLAATLHYMYVMSMDHANCIAITIVVDFKSQKMLYFFHPVCQNINLTVVINYYTTHSKYSVRTKMCSLLTACIRIVIFTVGMTGLGSNTSEFKIYF